MAEIACPFCGIFSEPYVIELHVEESHAESSPHRSYDAALAQSLAASDDEDNNIHEPSMGNEWTKCTRPGCGEHVLLSEIDEHLEVHAAIASAEGSSGEPAAKSDTFVSAGKAKMQPTSSTPRGPSRSQKLTTDKQTNAKRGPTLLEYFSGSSAHGKSKAKPYQPPHRPGRLGKRELGPHAFEKLMPEAVRRHLLSDALPRHVNKIGNDGKMMRISGVRNETIGVVPVLAEICAGDPTTQTTYFCHPAVKHVEKLKCDGNFCGYWNIQMVLSFLQGQGSLPDMRQLPNILEIQDTIEQAWTNGICNYGRIETGGVRGTRKWIGTSEAVAYFTQLGIRVEALAFEDNDAEVNDAARPTGELAATQLLDHVEAYFLGAPSSTTKTVNKTAHITHLPPIFFQRLGHSMTIIGLERKVSGERNLLVFDPSFWTSDAVLRLLEGRKVTQGPDTLMKAYRKSELGLAKWEEFEIVVVA